MREGISRDAASEGRLARLKCRRHSMHRLERLQIPLAAPRYHACRNIACPFLPRLGMSSLSSLQARLRRASVRSAPGPRCNSPPWRSSSWHAPAGYSETSLTWWILYSRLRAAVKAIVMPLRPGLGARFDRDAAPMPSPRVCGVVLQGIGFQSSDYRLSSCHWTSSLV